MGIRRISTIFLGWQSLRVGQCGKPTKNCWFWSLQYGFIAYFTSSPNAFIGQMGPVGPKDCLVNGWILTDVDSGECSNLMVHKWWFPVPNSWMVYSGKSYQSGWFRGTSILGTPKFDDWVSFFCMNIRILGCRFFDSADGTGPMFWCFKSSFP